MTGEKEDTETTRTLVLIATPRPITVRDWVIASCTAATIAKDSRTDTKMGIEGIKLLESQLNCREPDREVGLFTGRVPSPFGSGVRVRAYDVKNPQILT